MQILVPEGGGKALRTVEAEASPVADPFSDCTEVDDLLGPPSPTVGTAHDRIELAPRALGWSPRRMR